MSKIQQSSQTQISQGFAWCCKANPKLNPFSSKPPRACPALILSSALIAKATTWLMITNVLSGEITSTEIGTLKRLRKLGKLGLI